MLPRFAKILAHCGLCVGLNCALGDGWLDANFFFVFASRHALDNLKLTRAQLRLAQATSCAIRGSK
jgi:hypothetical protein